MGTLKLMTVSVQHEDCWTSEVREVEASTLNYQVYPERNYLRSRIIFQNGGKSVLNKFKKSAGVIGVNKVVQQDGLFLVDFLNQYKGSMAGLLYDMEVMIIYNRIFGGIESWSFALTKDRISEVLREISSHGKVVDYVVDDFRMSLGPRLSPSEKKVLKAAYANGYLEYPRRADADEVSSLLGLSKVTFLHHLRNAYRKLTSYYLSTVKD
ncbi:bacterio-opsin activator [Metallosphaera tengchongensis]|uniref:Bacterio-opsin activator n=1 Tax=Metallosphaera tengchongensis TaxID=1532350 RepID=A0A6N0NRS0_9CREN|nr:helix-turn-helix domain-containing protein [Metallosphaera tengchongensis]QKQ99411.1 bacterio-opsin activator [Metallosphaera tengchongensis]